MKPYAFDYVAPKSIDEALKALGDGTGEARFLAGGQSLVPIMNFRLAKPDLLIDINRIPALAGIDVRGDGTVRIGAIARHRAVETSAAIRDRLPLLHMALPYVAHVQIRNRGTIGGSLAHCDPAAEWPALCLALDAEIVATSRSGRRIIRADAFSLGIMTTALEPDELLTEVIFPAAPPERRYGFQEISRRRGDFALVGVACSVDIANDGVVKASRIAIFGAGDAPLLSVEASGVIDGRRITEAMTREAGRAASAAISPRADLHASAEYRLELIEALVHRALKQAAAPTALRNVA